MSTSQSFHPTRATKMSATDTVAVTTNFGPDRYNQPVSESGADAGSRTATRNAAGDVVSLTDARGTVFSIASDGLGRITSVTPAGAYATTVSYVPGRSDALPASMSDSSGSTSWSYDAVGRLMSKTQNVTLGTTRTLSMTRDAVGRVNSMTYPSGMRVDVTYNANGVASLAVNNNALLNNVGYHAFSQLPTSWTWGNGSTYSRSFDANGRVTQVTLGSKQRSYAYDAVGRITGQTDVGPSGTQAASMGYDEAGQLTSYTGPQGNFSYGYDSNGNRRSVTQNGSSFTNTYAAGTNRILTSPNGTYAYNADGNPSTDGAYNFVYDAYGRWSSMINVDYKVIRKYNGQGLRVTSNAQTYVCTAGQQKVLPGAAGMNSPLKTSLAAGSANKQAGGGTTASACSWQVTDSRQFFHDDSGNLLGEYNAAGAAIQETIWFAGQPVAVMTSGKLHYIFADHLATPRAIRRASDNLEVWRWDSEPFGNTLPTNPVSYLDAITYNLRFPGQQYDSMTGYHYNVMRDYNPATGRYLQADPIGLAGGMSRYAYVNANPLIAADPSGQNPILDVLAVLGTLYGGYSIYNFFSTSSQALGVAASANSALIQQQQQQYDRLFGAQPYNSQVVTSSQQSQQSIVQAATGVLRALPPGTSLTITPAAKAGTPTAVMMCPMKP